MQMQYKYQKKAKFCNFRCFQTFVRDKPSLGLAGSSLLAVCRYVLISGRKVSVSSASFFMFVGSRHHVSKQRRCVEQFCSSTALMARGFGRGHWRQWSSTSVWMSLALPGSLERVCSRSSSSVGLEQDSSSVPRPWRCAWDRKMLGSWEESALASVRICTAAWP